jgi:hypothetical protein
MKAMAGLMQPKSEGGGGLIMMWPNIEAWIPKLGFRRGGCDEVGVED